MSPRKPARADAPWQAFDQALMADAASPPAPVPAPCRPRLGVLGGTFDPIHIGHLLLAQEAAFRMRLDRVYFAPAGCPPHKSHQPVTPIQHRLAMTALAIRDNPRFAVSRLDIDEGRPSYSTALMQRLQSRLRVPADLFFLMGLDSLRDLPHWHEPAWLVQHGNLVVLHRPDVAIDWPALEKALPGIRRRVEVLAMPGLDVSGLNVRGRFLSRQPVRYLLCPAVIAYIKAHGLYADPRANRRPDASAVRETGPARSTIPPA